MTAVYILVIFIQGVGNVLLKRAVLIVFFCSLFLCADGCGMYHMNINSIHEHASEAVFNYSIKHHTICKKEFKFL